LSARSFALTLLFLAVSGLVHAMLGTWALDAFPRLRSRKRWVIAGLTALTLGGAVVRLVTFETMADVVAVAFSIAMSEFVIVLFSALPLIGVRLVARLVAWLGERLSPGTPPSEGAPITRREAIERLGGVATVAANVSLVGWGALRGRHAFEIDEVVVRIPGLPRVLDGYTLAQISDIHVGALVGERDLAEGLDKLARAKADLVVVTGDMVDSDPRWVPTMVRGLGSVRARDGVYAILGNHDYYTGADRVAGALRAAGIDVLINDGRLVRARDGGGFALLGVDDLASLRYGGPGPRLDRALSTVPEDRARVLLSHQPTTVDVWASRVALQLSGHTHGGQFNPGVRPADLFMRYVAGPYRVGATTLYVNRGFGVVGPPARIGAPPEVTKIVLVSA
jgi:predicted MPP superfamily phosphohydrolase